MPASHTIIDYTALLTAAVARLRGNGSVISAVENVGGTVGVWSTVVPPAATYSKPNIEVGIQDARNDGTYRKDSEIVLLRLISRGKGGAPGMGSFDDVITALNAADAALIASKLSITGHKVIEQIRNTTIPLMAPLDDDGYLRFQAGIIYRMRVERT